MAIVKFKAAPAFSWSRKIERVEVERESDSSVWIKGRRHSKTADYASYFDTWALAREALRTAATIKVDLAQRRLAEAQAELAAIEALQPPTA